MPLTSDQLTYLRADLQRLAGIKYDPVLAELLDHYATLTEQHMTTGFAFADASKWAWNDLGQGEGIQQIQDDYIASVQQQIRSQHLALVQSYFRWPTFLTATLVGVLVYLVVPLLPTYLVRYTALAIAFIPSFVMLWLERKLKNEPTSQRFLILEYMAKHNYKYVYVLINNSSLLLNVMSDNGRSLLLQAHSTFTVVVCLLLFLYSISFVQLLNQRFDFQLKTI